ncbi:MAG: hypothetical protein ABSG04_12620 [Verrucomicrobiota bacterium]|jgi:hypothetical protein
MNTTPPNLPYTPPRAGKTIGQQVVEKLRASQSRTTGERVLAERIARAGGSRSEVAALGAPSTIGASAPVTANTLTDPIVKANTGPNIK